MFNHILPFRRPKRAAKLDKKIILREARRRRQANKLVCGKLYTFTSMGENWDFFTAEGRLAGVLPNNAVVIYYGMEPFDSPAEEAVFSYMKVKLCYKEWIGYIVLTFREKFEPRWFFKPYR